MKEVRKIIFAVVLLLLAIPVWAGQFQAGVAKVEITPDHAVPLAGYGARYGKVSEGVLDRVYSRALVIDDGKTRMAVVSDDMLQVLEDLKLEVAKEVADLKLDGILLTATHTHSGPGGYSDIPVVKIAVMGRYDDAYRKFLVSRIGKAIREAAQNLKPAQFGSAVVTTSGFARNRRHEGGAVDNELGLAKITDASGKTIAYWINYAMHPTAYPAGNLKISGDWAGVLEKVIEEKEPGAVAMFFNAALGDQGAGCLLNEEPPVCVNRLGTGLAGEAWKNFPAIKTTDQVSITLMEKMAPIPELRLRKGCWTGIAWIMKRLGAELKREQGEFMAVLINDTLIYASPNELAVEVGKELKALHPDKKQMVFSHANDWLGYMLTPAEFDIGGYESCMTLYGREFTPYFVEQFKDLTEEVK